MVTQGSIGPKPTTDPSHMTHIEPSPQRPRPQQVGSFPNAWTLFSVRGIPVRLDRTWLLIAALVAFMFFSSFRAALPAHELPLVLALSAAGAVLFFASILAHELGHALTSLDRDIPVLSITLFALGGVTESTREARRARDEFVIVGIGPFISLVLAAAFGLAATVAEPFPTLALLLGYLGWINVMLAVFNIVPGYPLDGGRLLRSILWGLTGKAHASTRWAARVGQVFAGTLILFGLGGFLLGRDHGFPGLIGALLDLLGGLWSVLIGFFLFRGATASYQRAAVRERLERRSVRDVMGSVPPPIPPSASLGDALERVQQRPSLLWPVGDPVLGGVLLSQIDAVPSDAWESTRVADVAHDVSLVTVDVEQSLDDAIDKMAAAPQNMVIVVDHGRPVGLLTPSLVSDLAG